MESKASRYYWIYTAIIFIIVTAVFFYIFGGFATGPDFVSYLIVMLILGFIIALLSTYIIAPIILWKAFKDLNDNVIQGMLQQLSQKAGLKKVPKLMVFETPEFNAFTYITLFGPKLVLTSGLVNAFKNGEINNDELMAIMGHEIGHIKHKDTLRRWIVQSWISVFYSLGTVLLFTGLITMGIGFTFSMLDRDDSESLGTILVGIALAIAGGIMMVISKIISLLSLHHDRFNEYLADEFGARIAGGDNLIGALKKIEGKNKSLTSKDVPYTPYPDSWQVKPAKTSIIDRLFSDHPPLEKRIERIKKLGL
jgi:heat shock protein HtpX